MLPSVQIVEPRPLFLRQMSFLAIKIRISTYKVVEFVNDRHCENSK